MVRTKCILTSSVRSTGICLFYTMLVSDKHQFCHSYVYTPLDQSKCQIFIAHCKETFHPQEELTVPLEFHTTLTIKSLLMYDSQCLLFESEHELIIGNLSFLNTLLRICHVFLLLGGKKRVMVMLSKMFCSSRILLCVTNTEFARVGGYEKL